MQTKALATLLISTSLSLLAAGCSAPGVDLEKKGAEIKLTKEIPEQEKSQWEKVKELKCEKGNNGRTYIANKQACLNQLRNQAANAGAELVLQEPTKPGLSSIWGNKCSNCVEQNGVAYKKAAKKEVDTSAVSAAPVIDAPKAAAPADSSSALREPSEAASADSQPSDSGAEASDDVNSDQGESEKVSEVKKPAKAEKAPEKSAKAPQKAH